MLIGEVPLSLTISTLFIFLKFIDFRKKKNRNKYLMLGEVDILFFLLAVFQM